MVRSFYEGRGEQVRHRHGNLPRSRRLLTAISLRRVAKICPGCSKPGELGACASPISRESGSSTDVCPPPNSSRKTPMPGLWSTRSYPMRRIPKRNVRLQTRSCSSRSCGPIMAELLLTTATDLGLQVLDSVIMTRWKVLPRDQCQG